MDNLKPCPFDGYDGVIESLSEEDDDPHSDDWIICCCHCGATPHSNPLTKAKAVEVWNTRPDVKATKEAE